VACALVLTGLTTVPQAAQAAGKKPDLTVTSVSAPAAVRAGERLAVKAKVGNTGKARAKASVTAFYLSKDAKPGGDRKLAPTWATPGLAPGRSARATTKVLVPAGVTPGDYRVIACADAARKVAEAKEGNNCRASGVVTVDAPASSHQLIEDAVASGQLTEEHGLVYEVYSDYDDPRLPARFDGPANGLDEGALTEVAERWDGLSPATQDLLRPFLIPPFYAGSHWSPAPAGRPQPMAPSGPSFNAPWCSGGDVNPLYESWDHVDSTDGSVRIWWLADNPGDAALAGHLMGELEGKILPALTALMGRGPKADGGGACDGGSPALDIALVDADTAMTYADDSCGAGGTSAHMLFPRDPARPTWPGLDPYLAHEVMHAIQFAMPVAGDCGSYSWLREMTAEWVQDYVTDPAYGVGVSPDDTEFRAAPRYFRFPEKSLEDATDHHDYGDYLLPFWAARHSSPAVVRAMWDNAAGKDALHAVDDALPGGFRQSWPEFTLANWNQAPLDDYRTWDGLTQTPKTIGPEWIPPDVARTPTVVVQHLAARYLVLDVDAKVKEIEYTNDLAGDPDAKVHAVIEYSDGTHAVVDLSGQAKTTLCLDDGTKRATAVVLVYSNSSMTKDTTFKPTLLGKKICSCVISSQRPGVSARAGGVCQADASLSWTWTDDANDEDWDITRSGTGSATLVMVEDPDSPGSYESGPGSTYTVSEQSHLEYVPHEGGGCPESGDSTNAGSGALPDGNALGNMVDDEFWLVQFVTLPTTFHSTGQTCAGPSAPETRDTAVTPAACPIRPASFDGFYEFTPVAPGSKTFTFSCSDTDEYVDGDGLHHTLTAHVTGTITLP
jgi:hypothetical protein